MVPLDLEFHCLSVHPRLLHGDLSGQVCSRAGRWSKLFIDGLKYIAASLIYGIPVLLIMLFFGGFAFLGYATGAAIQGNPALFISALIAFIVGIFLAVIVAIIIAFISTIGIVRMARTDEFGEAFNFSAILATIRDIGWGHYILALLVLWVVSFIFSAILSALAGIPVLGWILWLLALPAIAIFEARYIYLIYMNGAPETVAEPREYPEQPSDARKI
ncbi:MAG TPA: DUF4013 domain-containing protein [Methanomicrobiales archaeon]|nr:DUF4013 domain-containing protein [Methanomicrobiales archaeon]